MKGLGLEGRSKCGENLSRLRRLVDEQLEVYAASVLSPIVHDVFGPGAALDVDQHAGGRVDESDEDERRLVVLLVREREEVALQSTWWNVLHLSDVLFIGRVLKNPTQPS